MIFTIIFIKRRKISARCRHHQDIRNFFFTVQLINSMMRLQDRMLIQYFPTKSFWGLSILEAGNGTPTVTHTYEIPGSRRSCAYRLGRLAKWLAM